MIFLILGKTVACLPGDLVFMSTVLYYHSLDASKTCLKFDRDDLESLTRSLDFTLCSVFETNSREILLGKLRDQYKILFILFNRHLFCY